MRFFITLFLFIAISNGQVYGQSKKIDFLTLERRQSLLVDGGIRDLTGGSVDKMATGLLGFRQETIGSKWDFAITAYSSQNSIKSTNQKDYSRLIINPFISQSGASLSGSYLRTNLSRKAMIVNHLRLLYSSDEISSEEFDNTISHHDLDDYKKNKHRFGLLFEYNFSNFSWTNSSDTSKDGNIIALNPYLIFSKKTFWDPIDNFVEIFGGIGPSFRYIAGDIGSDPYFIKSTLNTERKSYTGAQATMQIFVNNLFAKAYYGYYGGNKINGLTGGQFFVSMGLQAELGTIRKKQRSISDLLNKDLPLNITR